MVQDQLVLECPRDVIKISFSEGASMLENVMEQRVDSELQPARGSELMNFMREGVPSMGGREARSYGQVQ